MGFQIRNLTPVIMESKLLVLVFLSSVLASEFFVDIENENPLSRTLCCLTANAQSKCATNCANQDCAATCTVRCGILNSVCGTYTCSGVTTTCTTSTSTASSAAAATTTCTTGGTLAQGAACLDTSFTSLGSCHTGCTCIPFTGASQGGYCVVN